MKRRNFLVVCTAVLFAFCFTFTASGANEVAEVSVGSSGIYWQPKASYAQISLTVSCPDGQVFQKKFEGGVAPYLDLSDIKGQFKDGSYTYELRVTPFTKKTREGGAIARKSGGDIPGLRNLTQTGYFTVHGGAIITPGAVTERGGQPAVTQGDPARPQDQVILDDLIVDGSICAGFDCINGESFGFDTLILKENNLRIYFRDTSNSATFPTNDWRITVNDSSNGGANKFSIDDVDGGRTPFTIEASAPSNSIYVDDGGRVGFGKSTPVADLHVATGNTPTLRLEQDGSSGFTPQTWDVAGNEANFFIRDATNGSTLPFRIRPGAPSSAIDVAASGDVGMGTDSPTHALHIKRSANLAIKVERDGYVQNFMNATSTFGNFGTINDFPTQIMVNSDWRIRFNESSNSKVLEVNSGGATFAYSDGTDWFPASSREAKENIDSLPHDKALQALNELDPVTYNYKTNKEEARVGFIAEDVPELVAINGRKHVNSMDILAVLTKVVQEQQKTITELKEKIAELEKK